jgi:hypothetical protein
MRMVLLLRPSLQMHSMAYIARNNLDLDVGIRQYFDDSQGDCNQVLHNLVEIRVVDSLDSLVHKLTH